MSDTTDPFAGGDKTPSLSFDQAPVGTTYTGRVTAVPSLVQARDFKTGDPAFWPDGNAKMAAVVTADFGGTLGVRSVWAGKPSAMFQAIAEAQAKAGAKITPGGTITVTYTGDGVRKDGDTKLNPPKQYAVTYTPADAFGEPVQVPAYGTAPAPATAPVAPAAVPAMTPEQVAAFTAYMAQQAQAAAAPVDKPPF